MNQMTLTQAAKFFWKENTPDKRLFFVTGIHPLAYLGDWNNLTKDEKLKVKSVIKASRE